MFLSPILHWWMEHDFGTCCFVSAFLSTFNSTNIRIGLVSLHFVGFVGPKMLQKFRWKRESESKTQQVEQNSASRVDSGLLCLCVQLHFAVKCQIVIKFNSICCVFLLLAALCLPFASLFCMLQSFSGLFNNSAATLKQLFETQLDTTTQSEAIF